MALIWELGLLPHDWPNSYFQTYICDLCKAESQWRSVQPWMPGSRQCLCSFARNFFFSNLVIQPQKRVAISKCVSGSSLLTIVSQMDEILKPTRGNYPCTPNYIADYCIVPMFERSPPPLLKEDIKCNERLAGSNTADSFLPLFVSSLEMRTTSSLSFQQHPLMYFRNPFVTSC